MTALALDQFVLTGPHGGSAPTDVASLGLVETRRVKHRGQGTANRCYAFENAYLELPPAMGPLARGAGFTTLHVEPVMTPESSAALALVVVNDARSQ